jgi:cytochrome c
MGRTRGVGLVALVAALAAILSMAGTAAAAPLEKVLVFSKTSGFRHDSIQAGITAVQEIGAANGFAVDATEDATAFTEANLAQYDAVIWLNTTGDVLNDEQQGAFENYIGAGNGYVGIHSAADTEYGWDWYGDLVGGFFASHPPGTPTAAIDVEDATHPSTATVPTRWTRTDEWYNYKPPAAGAASGADYSPRYDVHVLATVDESTYAEGDGTDGHNDDHPIAWCSNFAGGHSWYTGLGHTIASFSEPAFRAHLLGGIQSVTDGAGAGCGPDRVPSPSAADFEKVTLDDDTQNPFELDVAPDGRVFYIERNGQVRVWKPTTETTVEIGTVPVTTSQENGLLGIQLAPDFMTSGHVYLAYSALPDNENQNRLSRFTVVGDQLQNEQVIYTWQHQRDECCHTAGSLAFGLDGSLFLSTGDNTNPFESSGFTPIDERPGREAWDAQRTAANSNDPNGKILRIVPLPNASGVPGIGTTYAIPPGNMFDEAQDTQNQTLPEIYAMGFRNPFRITVDPKTGWLLLGDYGPDAGATVANRGPQGSVEFNVVDQPGFYGWPYCVRDNVPYNDFTFPGGPSGPKFDCANPVNNSPNNTGLTNLPPAQPATTWHGYTERDARFPYLGTGGAPTGGPRYDYDPANPSTTKFPEFYDGKWFIGEWNNGWIKTATLNDDGSARGVGAFDLETGYLRPMDIEFGPDGSLYVIEWGSGFGGNNIDSGIYRIDYVGAGRRPIAQATATPDSGPAPLTVSFSSAGSNDPDGTALTYAWDFNGDGTTDSTEPNPIFEYTTAGNFTATLRVTDESGATGVDNVPIVVGNSRPQVTIEFPENGQVARFGDVIPYEITVTDAEDGSTTGGGIACADVTLNISLGHDEHAHELAEKTGCVGTFETLSASGHGDDANVFPVIEAVYTDRGGAGAGALTGRDEAVLQPDPKQAEFFDSTGRVPGGGTDGDPGVQTETTSDPQGGGQNIGFIEDGDYVSYEPFNLEGIRGITFRVASGGAGGTIQLRLDAPDGPLVAETATIAPTGGWQNWTDVNLDLPTPPEGTHELFVVFRGGGGGLMNLNFMRFLGKGAAISEAPIVTASADPETGTAPLTVNFNGEATDPDAAAGDVLAYHWDFGVAGTTTDTSTEPDPMFTYENAGTYRATLTVTDATGQKGTATVEVRVTSTGGCPTGTRSDEFDGNALDTNRWTVIRSRDDFEVANGSLRVPIGNGSIYAGGTTAGNIIVQDTPDGAWEVTSKITTEPLTENYQQAGLRVYSDDDNWASVHMISAGGQRDFEFIYENAGNPRNEGLDKLGGIPATSPTTYWVRITSDGQQLTASYSFDGTTFSPVGRPAPLSTFANPRIGPVALSDQAPSVPNAFFDWIRFNPDTGGGGGGGAAIVDEFDGTSLAMPPWEVVRQDQNLTVSGGALRIPAAQGDIYGLGGNANNLVLRDAPDGAWEAVTKLNFEGTAQYHQAGLIVYGDDDNFTKFGRIAHTAAGDEKFEFIYENAGSPRNDAADSTGNVAADFPDDFYLRMTSDGTNVTGAYSTDGASWTPVGRPAPLPANARIGVFSFSNQAATAPVAAFDSFRLTGPGGPAGPSRDDQFDGASLDKTRWNAIVRDVPGEYSVSGGELTITTSPGDIYTGDTTPPPNNFILQSADHAGADWVIETKLSGTINGGYGQGGLMAFQDGSNYVKFDAISDAGNTRINRIELRSEVNGAIAAPEPNVDVPVGTTNIWLRLTKTGTSYAGEYSYDGQTWVAMAAPVTNAIAAPSFGLFAFGPQADGQGDTVSFDYFTLDGPDGCEPPPPTNAAPVIGSVSASPTSGFGPLQVAFNVSATDADNDPLTYSWDFDGNGTEDSTAEDPSHTYTAPGVYEAEVTVSDGDAQRSQTVTITVLAPDDPNARFRVLVFSKTTGFRHDSIDEGIAAIRALGSANEFQVDATEDATAFRDSVLGHYDTVAFLNTTGDPLNGAQQAAFERYIRAGGGYTGIHSAADTEYDWTWYGKLVGAYFLSHPPGTPTASVIVEDRTNRSTAHLMADWTRTDEWYNYRSPLFADPNVPDGDYSPREGGVHVLTTVDESDYDEQDGSTEADDHPIAWCQPYDGGRSWYTGGGHTAASFSEPDFVEHLLGGIEITAGAASSPECTNEGPSVQAGADPQTGNAPLSVSFSSSGTDPEGQTLAYSWDFDDGGSALGQNPTHIYQQPGTYMAKVTVTDPDGSTGTAEVEIIVTEAPNRPPTVRASADPLSGNAPLDVRFSAEGTDPDGDALLYEWDFGDGGSAFGAQATHRYLAAGTYDATVTVTDPDGATGTATVRVTVSGNRAPSVTLTADPQSGTAPLRVRFTANGSDPDGGPLRYSYDFGDGSPSATGRRATHTYAQPGTYTARVTATDRDGAAASAQLEITVNPPP